MIFYNEKHKEFYEDKLTTLELYNKADVYYKSVIYLLGLTETTRENFKEIFDIKSGEININAIQSPFQTSTSLKVTRMAFSLWNRCYFDSEDDIENANYSPKYNVCEVFNCELAPYFYEAIKIRFPEYTRDKNIVKDFER